MVITGQWECSRNCDDDEAQKAAKNALLLAQALSRWSDGPECTELRLDKRDVSDKVRQRCGALLFDRPACARVYGLGLQRRLSRVTPAILCRACRKL
jgi:hypothetical protein